MGRCACACASDGFVYNCAVLCIDRALFHRRGLALSLAADLRGRAGADLCRCDVAEYVAVSLQCHIEVRLWSEGHAGWGRAGHR